MNQSSEQNGAPVELSPGLALSGDVEGTRVLLEARLRGMREGYAEGYRISRENALQQVQTVLAETQADMQAVCTRISEETKAGQAARLDALPTLAMQEARRVLEETLHSGDDAYLHLFAHAAGHVSSTAHAVLRANAYGCAVASRHLAWMKKQIDGLQELEIRQSEGEDGLCILETDAGSVDASVETQFRKAMQAAGFLVEDSGENGHVA